MTNFNLALLLLLLSIAGVVVRKTYYYLPAREVKRRAEAHDKLASRLYPAIAYGSSLRALLWVWIVVTSAGGFVLLARIAPTWLALVAVISLIWVIHSWLPSSRVTKVGALLTAGLTPFITWLLNLTHPLLSRGANAVEHRYTAPAHTGLFDREDLLELIEQQQRQPDNRLTDEELEIARRALCFGDYKVSDILTPRKKVKTVLATDTVGPVLIDELHKSGVGYMLVRDEPKGTFVGSLAFRQLGLHSSGQVRDIMSKEVYYLHENDNLGQALHAFFATHHPVFVVVNSFEEFVGILTADNIIRQLLGQVPGEDFENYHDVTAVAERHIPAKPEPPAEKALKPSSKPPQNKKSKKSKPAEVVSTESNKGTTDGESDDKVLE